MEELHAQIISRSKAKEIGMKYLFSGKKCKNGNIWYRFSANGQCYCEDCRASSIEGRKKYWERNRDHLLDKKREYAKKNTESIKESYRSNYKKNRSKRIERSKSRYREKSEELKSYQRGYFLKNRERIKKYSIIYRKRNPEIFRFSGARRRSGIRDRTIGLDSELMELTEREAHHLACVRREKFGFDWHVDHRVPLMSKTASGLHYWENLQVIPSVVNLSKSNKMEFIEDFEWIRFFV